MSHPDPLFDPDNSYEDDDMRPRRDHYDDHDDYEDFSSPDSDPHGDGDYDPSYDDDMDGDFDSSMRDAGFGTDEDYGSYGDDF